MITEEELKQVEVHQAISHLSINEINDLMSRYYKGEKVNQLINDFNLDIRSSQLVKTFPPIIEIFPCEYCNGIMQTPRPSKTSYQEPTTSCQSCGHTLEVHCNCKNCTNERERRVQEEKERKVNLIKENYDIDKYDAIPENWLSLEDKLYLSTLLRARLDENFIHILPLQSVESLSPTSKMDKKVVDHLISRGIIKPSPRSPIEAFTGDEESPFPKLFYTFKVCYHINIRPFDSDRSAMLNRMLNLEDSEFNDDPDFLLQTWREIALEECIQYLLYNFNSVGFDNFKRGEKTEAVFKDLLNNFSTSQIYSIIYREVAQATRLYQERRLSKLHAANTVISRCQKYGERAVAENWTLTKYKRPYELEQSLISEIFFNRVLGIANLGFDEVPTL